MPMVRVNSGYKNLHNFFAYAFFLFLKNGSDSVNHADSEDINILVRLSGNSILKLMLNF